MNFLSKKRVTIKQVAQEAGVSAQTVSRVINERPDVALETRQRVLEVIERMGYRPNVLARSLIRQRSFTLGVVTAGLKYIGPSRTLHGVTAEAERMGYTLLLKELPGFDGYDVGAVLDEVLARQVDGIIWAVAEMSDNRTELVELLPALATPIVFLAMQDRPGWHIVSTDNRDGGRTATEYLLTLGHRRIGHLAGPLSWWEARERLAGWRDAMNEAGIEVTPQHWVEGNWSSASGSRAIVQLFDQFPEMTAVFAANDQMALGILQHAHRHGISVPGQLSVIGFDGIPEAAYFCPPLSTMDHDQHELGRLAVRRLVALIEAHQEDAEPPAPERRLLQPELVIRESTSIYKPQSR